MVEHLPSMYKALGLKLKGKMRFLVEPVICDQCLSY